MNKYAVVVGIGHQFGFNIGGDNDAKLMVRILTNAGFNSKNIKVLTNSKATKASVICNIEWLKGVEDSNSEVVFFFSGHGGPEAIMLYDTTMTSTHLASLLSDVESNKQLVCVQACYSGSLVNELEAPKRIVVSSSLPDTVSHDNRHYTLWGYCFLDQGIIKGKADANNDGLVSIQETYHYSNMGLMLDNYGQEFFL